MRQLRNSPRMSGSQCMLLSAPPEQSGTQAGLTLPCGERVSASQSLYPRALCSIQPPPHQPATAPLPQKHQRLSEQLRIGFYQLCTWVHNSCSAKYPFGRMGTFWHLSPVVILRNKFILYEAVKANVEHRTEYGNANLEEKPCQQGWRLNHFPGQPVPMLDNPLGEEKFPNIQSKPPLAQLEAISSCPITCYLGEETDPHLSTTSFQTLHQLRCPSLDTLQPLNVSLVVRGPKLNTVFEVRPHQCRVQGHNHFPSPAGHAIFDTSQDAIGFLGRLGTLLAHIQPAVNKHPQTLNATPLTEGKHVQLEAAFALRLQLQSSVSDSCTQTAAARWQHAVSAAVLGRISWGLGWIRSRLRALHRHPACSVPRHCRRSLPNKARRELTGWLIGHPVFTLQTSSAAAAGAYLPLRQAEGAQPALLNSCATALPPLHFQSHGNLSRSVLVRSSRCSYARGVLEEPYTRVTGYKQILGWRLNHCPGQPVPMLDNPFSEVKFPNIQSKPPLVQLEAISSCPITCYLGEETDPHLSTTSFQAKQSQLPQPILIRLVLQTLHQLCCPSLDTLQHLNVSLVVGGPKTEHSIRGAASPVLSTGGNHFPSPAGHTIFDTSQDAIGFLGRLGTLLAHIQPAVNQRPQVLLRQAACQPLFPKPVALHGVAVAQVQDPTLGLVKPHTIDLGPSIQPVPVPLQSLPTLKQINTPTQLGVVCKLTESALDPFVQIIDKDIKQNWPQHRAQGNTACDRPPTGYPTVL
ncbi:hypothetical protein QYF61_002175 [Mycteria americana]|uniref:Uncharacterized protein n=1 Tax=Mycteria americana TaxID=33587 RepID=A0AAN7SC35_MYCAM|nr:hypothetical protein QYF61_002175 [Mycteria americana]